MAFYTSEIMTGAPAEFKTDTQRIIYERLENEGVEYTRIESDPGISMDDCLNIDRAFGIDTVKTILLTNRQKNRFWLYVTCTQTLHHKGVRSVASDTPRIFRR